MEFLIVLAIIIGILVFIWTLYNGLVVSKKRVEISWHDIDIQLKKRYDLLPDLIETAKKAANLDESIFTKVTQLRSQAMSTESTDPTVRASIENQLSSALNGLKVAVEAYPDIKSHAELLQLMNLTRDIEDKIAYSRQFYNQNVLDYNTRIEVFPAVLFAKSMGFENAKPFEAAVAEREDIKVSF
ncbi:MAG: LemA family protein [bacterium]|nr:LemA family protein [bacterium]